MTMPGTELQQFNCTTCPSECLLTVTVETDDAGEARATGVTGNRCPRGARFAVQEITCPVRVLATTVRVEGGDERLLPVRTAEAIPRALHLDAMQRVRQLSVAAPVRMGDVIEEDFMGTGVALVASMDVAAR